MRTSHTIVSYRLILALLVLLVWTGCEKPDTTQPEQAEGEAASPPEPARFDPLGLPADQVVVPPSIEDGSSMDGSDPVDYFAGLTEEDDSSAVVRDQFMRVQIHTTTLYGDAQQLRRVAEEIFEEPVYVDYEVPYYKIRLGDFTDRDEAEAYRLRAMAAGFPEAWVVSLSYHTYKVAPLYDSLMADSLDVGQDDSSSYDFD